MNSELAHPAISTRLESAASPKRNLRRVAGVLAASVMVLSACNSDPGRKRVVEDIIQTSVDQGDLTQAQGDCMFDKVEGYSESQLEDITKSAGDAGPGTAIELYESDLASCK